MTTEKIIDDDLLGGLDRLLSDPAATHLMRPERLGGRPVGVQTTGQYPVNQAPSMRGPR
jgi:hypothetical protein